MSGASKAHAITFDPKAIKELSTLDKPVARRVIRAVEALSTDPRPDGVRPLVGAEATPFTLRLGANRRSTLDKVAREPGTIISGLMRGLIDTL